MCYQNATPLENLPGRTDRVNWPTAPHQDDCASGVGAVKAENLWNARAPGIPRDPQEVVRVVPWLVEGHPGSWGESPHKSSQVMPLTTNNQQDQIKRNEQHRTCLPTSELRQHMKLHPYQQYMSHWSLSPKETKGWKTHHMSFSSSSGWKSLPAKKKCLVGNSKSPPLRP